MGLIKTVKLADADACVPWPGVPGRLAPREPFTVSVLDPFWSALLADGTLVEDATVQTGEETVEPSSPVEPSPPVDKPIKPKI